VIGRNLLSLANPGKQESQPYLGEIRARPAPTAFPPVGPPLNGPISCKVQMASVWPCFHRRLLGWTSLDLLCIAIGADTGAWVTPLPPSCLVLVHGFLGLRYE